MMSALILLSGCNANNTTKGGIIGGASGTALGALAGKLIGGSTKSTVIGAAVGAAVGTTAGVLIGKKMDKAKAAAAAATSNATVESVTDANGLEAVKVTFDNGILFSTGKYALQSSAQSELKNFASKVLNVYTDCDVAIQGYASSDGSDATNLTLSQNRADAVKNYLTGTCGVSSSQIKEAKGYGETNLITNADGSENRAASRRVEVYLYASSAMIKAAEAGTLK
jgi:outer membrane protein OmpA-like peptidoglycan-associated protein